MALYIIKALDLSRKIGTQQTKMSSTSEAGENMQAALSPLRPLLQAMDLDDARMMALLIRGVGLEEPVCEGPVPC